MENESGYSNTTLIIGAGAHVPYGFPTSKGLHRSFQMMNPSFGQSATLQTTENERHISTRLQCLMNEDNVTNALFKIVSDARSPENLYVNLCRDNDWQYVRDRFVTFIRDFGSSSAPSIDRFIEKCLNTSQNREDFPLIGKTLIAIAMNFYEKEAPVSLLRQDWIQFIITKYLANDQMKKFLFSPPNIITFNYDMLFERCILDHLKSFHGYNTEDALDLVKGLNILHVHGNIDSLTGNNTKSFLISSINELRVIEEKEGCEGNLEKLKGKISTIMSRTDCLYFLGFGFDEGNMRLLFGKNFSHLNQKRRKYYSTNVCLGKEESRRIKREFPLGIKFYDDEDVDCMTLLREKNPLEQSFVIKEKLENSGSFRGGGGQVKIYAIFELKQMLRSRVLEIYMGYVRGSSTL